MGMGMGLAYKLKDVCLGLCVRLDACGFLGLACRACLAGYVGVFLALDAVHVGSGVGSLELVVVVVVVKKK